MTAKHQDEMTKLAGLGFESFGASLGFDAWVLEF
jgi:hypothetical protein